MKLAQINTAKLQPVKPIYCRQCRSQFTFDRYPEGDIKTEAGKVVWEMWCCSECGNTTIYQVKG